MATRLCWGIPSAYERPRKCPFRSKGKTLEAFVNAIPLVTTSIGLQGISSDQPLAFMADDAHRLAEAVLRAQTDTVTAKTHVEVAARYMKQTYSMQALRDAFARFVREPALARGDAPVAARTQEHKGG